jgi:transposase
MDAKELPTDVEVLKALLLKMQRQQRQYESSLKQAQRESQLAKQQVIELSATISDQAKKIQAHEHKILELLKALRGKQRERINPDQLLLFEMGELETLIKEQQEADKPHRRRRKKPGRRIIPDGLPQEIIEYELPENERSCPVDGRPLERIRWEESKQLDYVPAKIKVIVHRRAVYACSEKHDQAKLVTAPKPPQPIEKGLATAGLLAQVVVSKFGDHLPGYRQEDIFSRHGIHIRRSTIYDWMAQVADLCQPLYQLMVDRVLQSKVIHTDDTKVKLIDTALRGTRTARFWAYLGDHNNRYAVYDFTEDRSRDGPAKFLNGFNGYLQADAYSAYDGIYLDPDHAVIEVACWAHCRRYWHRAKEHSPDAAHHALAYISRLYEIERAATDFSVEARQAARTEHAIPLLADFKQWLDEQSFLPKSLIGKALTYTLNQWAALNRYVEDGDLSIDNNWAERAMRPIAIGRKNWLFVGSPRAGQRAAVLASLIASCKENLVEPWAYLKDVLTRMPYQPSADELHALLPDHWLAANPQHRWDIAETRRDERERKL